MKNWMKQIFSRVLRVAMFGVVLSSCTNEMEQPFRTAATEGTPVNINLNLRSIGTAEGEDQINTVRILQVNDNIAGEILTNTFILDVTENLLTVELVSGKSRIYVVVNEGNYIGVENSKLANVTTYAELTQVALGPYYYYEDQDVFYSNIPMFGSVMNVRIYPSPTEPQSATNPGTVSVNGISSGNTLQVSLERLVCKMKLHMKLNLNGNLVNPLFYDDYVFFYIPESIPLFEDYEGRLEYRDWQFSTRDFTNYDAFENRELDYYWNTRDYYLPSFSFTPCNDVYRAATLRMGEYSDWGNYYMGIPFGHNMDPTRGDIDYTLHRNHSYLLTVTANDERKIDLWMDWVHEEVEAPTFGGCLNVPDEVIMDKDLRNGSYTVEVSYDSDVYSGYYNSAPIRVWIDGREITTEIYDVSLPGCPDWLTVATLSQSRGRISGRFTFTYKETTGPHPDYVITFQCGNIVKEMRVVYGQKTIIDL